MISRIIRATRTQSLHPRAAATCAIHTSPAHLNESSSSSSSQTPIHTTDSYNKDTDTSPPADSKIHRVDPGSENVQTPYEAPSGEWSRAGTRTNEYMSANRSYPYAVEKGPSGASPSQTEGGTAPAGMTSGGMKPQGR